MAYCNPIVPFLEAVVEAEGSDLHLVTGGLPRIRCDGQIKPVKRDEENNVLELQADDVRTLILGTMPGHLHGQWEQARDVDYSFDGGPALGRYRVNAYFEQRGPAAVFRRVPEAPASMEEVDLPPAVHQLVDLRDGLVLLVGPTGAGKSTSLAAMVNAVNQRRAGVILTIEDPVEFAYREEGCVISQREVGSDTPSYAAAAKAGLRQDPDVIVLGEVRGADVLTQVLALAETGHLVFTTIHGGSAPGGLSRLVGLVSSDREEAIRRQVAGVTQAVIAQTLVPRADGRGRIAAFELLLRRNSTVNKIRDGLFTSLRAEMNDRASGMLTLERSLAELVIRGEVRLDQALLHANDRDAFLAELRTARSE